MKRLTIFLFIAVLLIGSIHAQPLAEQRTQEQNAQTEQLAQLDQNAQPEQFAQTRQNREPRQREYNSVTVEGILKLERGFATIESGDTVYYVPMLTRFMGFISELTEGAVVSVEGNGYRNFIQPAKVTIDGKSYDFTALFSAPVFGQNLNPRNPQQMREPPKPKQRDNLRQNPPQMGKTPRFNQPNRNVPVPGNTFGRNRCNCNCETSSP